MQAVYDPIVIRYRLFTILSGPDTGCIRTQRDPIQAAYDSVWIRYRLYTILSGPDTGCMRSCMERIQAVYDPIGTRYRLYRILSGSDTDCIRSCRDAEGAHASPKARGHRKNGCPHASPRARGHRKNRCPHALPNASPRAREHRKIRCPRVSPRAHTPRRGREGIAKIGAIAAASVKRRKRACAAHAPASSLKLLQLYRALRECPCARGANISSPGPLEHWGPTALDNLRGQSDGAAMRGRCPSFPRFSHGRAFAGVARGAISRF